MSSKPILFSAAMVRALLDGSKTQTRRLVNPQPSCPLTSEDVTISGKSSAQECWDQILKGCKYGQAGDYQIVKETARLMIGSEESLIQYRADMAIRDMPDGWHSNDPVLHRWITSQALNPKQWRPSILMPVKASRITLKVVSIRIERLQDISDADAIAEGIEQADGAWRSYCQELSRCVSPVTSYRTLWDSINGPGSWKSNPWVWVVEFSKL